jgi:hypothetical protein
MNDDTAEKLITRKHELLNLIQEKGELAGEYRVELEEIQTRIELELRKRERESLTSK